MDDYTPIGVSSLISAEVEYVIIDVESVKGSVQRLPASLHWNRSTGSFARSKDVQPGDVVPAQIIAEGQLVWL